MNRLTLIFVSLFALLNLNVNAEEYPLQITPEGFIFISVEIIEGEKSNFLFDTGAGLTVVSGKMFNKIKNISTESGVFTGFRHDGDRLDGKLYTIPKMKLAGITKENVELGVYPPLDAYNIEGLVSLKFFEDRAFTIDFKNSKLIIHDEKELKKLEKEGEKIEIYPVIHGKTAIDVQIPLCVNGITMDAEFDTGSGYGTLILNPHFINKLKLTKEKCVTREYRKPISRMLTIDSCWKVSDINICGNSNDYKLNEFEATFRRDLIYEALIGSEIFRGKSVTIDIPNRQMILR